MTESRSYGQTSNTVFENAETKPVEGEGKKNLIVVASSDKGLCGGIHSGLSKTARRILLEKPETDIVVIGEKSKSQLTRSNGRNIVLSFAGVGKDVPTFADAQAIADQISLLPTDYSSVKIIYNKFINATSYEATPLEAYSEEAIVNSRKHRSIISKLTAWQDTYKWCSQFRSLRDRRRSPRQPPRIRPCQLPLLGTSYLSPSHMYENNRPKTDYDKQALAEGHACEQSARRNAMDVSSPNQSTQPEQRNKKH